MHPVLSGRTSAAAGCLVVRQRGQLDQFQLPGPRCRLRAAVRVELAVEVVDVGLDGAHADEEFRGDPTVGLAGGYMPEVLELPLAGAYLLFKEPIASSRHEVPPLEIRILILCGSLD